MAAALPGMVAAARRLLRRSGFGRQAARLAVGNPLRGLAFPDRHFDLVLAAHVVHGFSAAEATRPSIVAPAPRTKGTIMPPAAINHLIGPVDDVQNFIDDERKER